jgi:teichuronic acid exporter
MLVNLPMMLGLAAMAGPLIVTVLGDAWGPAVVPFQILCIAGVFWPLHLLNINILLAQGKSKLVLVLEIPKKMVGVSLLVVGVQFGIEGVAWSQVAFSIFAFFINGHFSAKSVGHGALAQVRDIWATAVLAAFMAGIVGALSLKLSMAAPLKLGILATVGVAFFVLASRMLNLRALNDALDLLRRHKPGSAMEIVS